MKVYLFNDTTNGHSGSKAVMNAFNGLYDNIIARHLVGSLEVDRQKFQEADAIIVNGEGTIHHNAERGNFLLDMLAVGQKMGKKTYLLNALFQDVHPSYKHTIKNLDLFTVREIKSYQFAESLGCTPILTGDYCLIEAKKQGVKTKDLSGIIIGTVHGESPSKDILKDNYFSGFKQYGFEDKFIDMIENLKGCDCYITGSHHGIYAAGLAGIPFIPLASNSWKIESLMQTAGVNIYTCLCIKNTVRELESFHSKMEEYQKFYNFLLTKQKEF